MTSAEDVLDELKKFFPGQITPPVVFVEWLASVPIEIEMVAQLPSPDKTADNVEFFTPPDVRPSTIFSKVALVNTDRQIYISGQYAKVPSRGEPQAKHVFGQLQDILKKTGSDIFYILRTGCQWKAAPREYGSGSALHSYFQEWTALGIFYNLWKKALLEYDEIKGIQWEWQSMDGAMTKSPLGGEKNREKPDRSRKTRRQKVRVDRRTRCAVGRRYKRRQYA